MKQKNVNHSEKGKKESIEHQPQDGSDVWFSQQRL